MEAVIFTKTSLRFISFFVHITSHYMVFKASLDSFIDKIDKFYQLHPITISPQSIITE